MLLSISKSNSIVCVKVENSTYEQNILDNFFSHYEIKSPTWIIHMLYNVNRLQR